MTAVAKLTATAGLAGVALLTPLVGMLRAISAFGLQPTKLIAAVATTRHDESARQQAGARYRFAREFQDFTSALDSRPLVIFIDDLDRCRAENVIEVLEAVNFLITSGRCIVVIGMARRWVETCVGLAFKELAAAHIVEEDRNRSAQAATINEQELFARHYLEKLINIEIRVPRLTEAATSAILQGDTEPEVGTGWRYQLGTLLLRTAPLAMIAGAIILVIWSAWGAAQWMKRFDSTNVEQQALTTQAPAPDVPAEAPRAANAPITPAPSVMVIEAAFEAPRTASSGWYLGTAGSVAVSLLALAGLALFARKEARTDDSPAFRHALAMLQPWILLGGASPRSLKRFINHVRYVAMRFRPAAQLLTTYERLANWIRAAFGRAAIEMGSSRATPRLQLSEELLVVLATLHRCGEHWLDELFLARTTTLAELIRRETTARFEDQTQRSEAAALLDKAIQRFNARFEQSRLFDNPVLDRARAVAFYEVMACEVDASPPVQENSATPLRAS